MWLVWLVSLCLVIACLVTQLTQHPGWNLMEKVSINISYPILGVFKISNKITQVHDKH